MSRAPRALVLALPALALGALAACAPPNAATPYPTTEPPEGEAQAEQAQAGDPNVVRFLGREIDLAPFMEGFPYERFSPSLEHGELFFIETGDRYLLRALALPPEGSEPRSLDLAQAPAITEVDWSTRSLWGVKVHGETDTLWLHADASNDEQMNLWRLPLAKGDAKADAKDDAGLPEPEQLTFADYVYGFGFSEDEARVGYLARSGKQAPYRTCLRLLDANDPKAERADQEVVCDSPELSFTWSDLHFSPSGEQVYFAALREGDRKRAQLVEVDLRSELPRVKVITNEKVSRNAPSVLEGWVDGDQLLFTANDEGFDNLYSWSRKTRKTRKLSDLSEEMLGAVRTEAGVFIAHGTPAGSTLAMLDARTGARLGEAQVPAKVSLLDGHGGRALWSQQSPSKVWELDLASFSRTGDELELANTTLVGLPAQLEGELVRCEVEAAKIPTFDGRELHAFVLRPKQPLAAEAGGPVAMVRSFYGGDNEWNRYDQILCAAGVTVVSPAVRGSSGFGKEFYGLNDRDLGGDEIVDLFWVARWIASELGVDPGRIGVYGRSHGGYATMRAMTFPPQTNARDESYRFAFGLAEAGFSDIVAFHDATNIPDWVVLEAGDPAVPEDRTRLEDRSPVNHVDLLQAPIFLLHGANDWRVPVDGSRAFVEAAEAAGKQVTYVEVPGQGHHIEGQERIVAAWQARFGFIEGVLAGDAAETAMKTEASAKTEGAGEAEGAEAPAP
ncbi:S9 family peptidase [Pseudenhygromyxa sp. WMMC2535]|uniref:S9 family peptidase n=1 Tax=Pseudenhygromyxa sp. WMMC2535 TaxID=2712867 RepID=UPI001552268F|nr:prolyl oligopeptidase family serine peptidase [Pseudenhygromyxa sp. WMMC2535]NVB38072.1 S9 family peptidase [Pseudenhygromyxa sp. WMMC2535]